MIFFTNNLFYEPSVLNSSFIIIILNLDYILEYNNN